MSSARKLQSEIDRVLKRVQEGVEEFDAIWFDAADRFHHCSHSVLFQGKGHCFNFIEREGKARE